MAIHRLNFKFVSNCTLTLDAPARIVISQNQEWGIEGALHYLEVQQDRIKIGVPHGVELDLKASVETGEDRLKGFIRTLDTAASQVEITKFGGQSVSFETLSAIPIPFELSLV